MDSLAIDQNEFRRVLGYFPTGVTVVTATVNDTPIGVAIGSFVSISLDPPLVGFFLGNNSNSLAAIEEAGHFCVNVLTEDHVELCGTMASRRDDKFAGIEYVGAPGSGAPIFESALATIDCVLDSAVEVGDHYLIVGLVTHLQSHPDGGNPLVFFSGRYGTFAPLNPPDSPEG